MFFLLLGGYLKMDISVWATLINIKSILLNQQNHFFWKPILNIEQETLENTTKANNHYIYK